MHHRSSSKSFQCNYLVDKSKFIGYIFNVDTIEQIKERLKELKQKYYDASHIAYGYILGQEIQFSDDQEPAGSAGVPIINAIKQYNLDHTLVAVVRYFGGKKLGISGLIKAYYTCAVKTIETAEIIDYYEYSEIIIKYNIFNDYIVYNTFKNKSIKYLKIEKNGEETIFNIEIKKDDLKNILDLDYKIIREYYKP